jgi:hypothetical protein
MRMHLEEKPPAPSSINPRVSPAVDAVIIRALAKEPGDRFQSAEELGAALIPALSGETDEGTSYVLPAAPQTVSADRDKTILPPKGGPHPPIPTPKRAPSTPPARPLAPPPEEIEPGPSRHVGWWVTAAVLVVAVGIAFVFWPRHRETHQGETQPTDTTVVSKPPPVQPVHVSVQARLPEDLPRGRLKTVTLALTHPDSGTIVDTITPVGGTIEAQFTVAPADSIHLVLRGYDATAKKLFEGKAAQSAPEGSHLFIDVPVTALVVAHKDTASGNPPPKVEPPQAKFNLVINVEPFTERNRIDEVKLDGKTISGAFPLKQFVSEGRHKLRWKIEGSTWTDTVTVDGEDSPVEKHLFVGSGVGRLLVAAPLPAGAGFANIYLDGVSTGQGTPGRLERVPAGPHEVEVRHPDYRMRDGSQIIDVQPNSDNRAEFEMVPR